MRTCKPSRNTEKKPNSSNWTVVSFGTGTCNYRRCDSCVAKQMRLSTSNRSEDYHGTEDRQEEIRWAKVQSRRKQRRGKRDAPAQARHAAQRAGRKGREGEEPKAGHRDWPLGGEKQGEEGTAEEGRITRKARWRERRRTETEPIEVMGACSPVRRPARHPAARSPSRRPRAATCSGHIVSPPEEWHCDRTGSPSYSVVVAPARDRADWPPSRS